MLAREVFFGGPFSRLPGLRLFEANWHLLLAIQIANDVRFERHSGALFFIFWKMGNEKISQFIGDGVSLPLFVRKRQP